MKKQKEANLSPFKSRLLIFIEHLGLSVLRFEKESALPNATVRNITDSLKEPNIEKIKARFPELNVNWLKTGEGEMLEGDGAIKSIDNQEIVIGFILNEIAEIKSSMKGTFYSDEKEALLSRIAQIDNMKK